MDSVCLGVGVASVFCLGKGKFLVLFSKCKSIPHLPLSKQWALDWESGDLYSSPNSERCWPHDLGHIPSPLWHQFPYSWNEDRRGSWCLGSWLSVSVAPGFCEPGLSIDLCFSTPPSSTLVCGTAMLLSDVQGTEKKESCFFLCAVCQTTLMWWTTGSGDTAHSVLFNTLPEREKGMDLLTCDFDSGLCIRPVIMWND